MEKILEDGAKGDPNDDDEDDDPYDDEEDENDGDEMGGDVIMMDQEIQLPRGKFLNLTL